MKKLTHSIVLLVAAALTARAHFVFVVPQPGSSSAAVFISETLEPDGRVDGSLVSTAKLRLRSAGGQDAALSLVKSGDLYVIQLDGSGTRVIHGLADLGVRSVGGKQYLLLYHPKTIVGDAFDPKTVVGGDVPVELIPSGKPGAVTLKLVARGKPLADSEVTVILPDGKEKKVKTDPSGQTEVLTQSGRYGAWARFWETSASGERDGKKYPETRHYATLVFDTSSAAPQTGSAGSRSAQKFATLPQAAASFGAVASGGWLYVYGGHVSPTHNYYVEAVSGRFDRLRLTGEPIWEELPGGPGLQGMNLAAHQGKIYRIGGMAPHNKKGEPSDNYSVADVARFDPESKRWEALPPLPEPRSSHDVVVIGDQILVTGGWNMRGRGNGEVWAKTTLSMDLSASKLAWRSAPQPFERRALMAAAFNGRMYVIGGINQGGTVESTVSIYDPKTGAWSDGPKLPGGLAIGFAPAAGVHQGSLYVSLRDGALLQLNQAGTAWEKAGSTTPRGAHRLASRGDAILVIGGAANGANSDLIEAVGVRR